MTTNFTSRLIHSLKLFFNTPDTCTTDAIFASHFVAHVPLMPPLNRSGFRSFVQGLYLAFPDLHIHVDDSLMIADKLVLRATFCGTHQGSFFGIAPTGCCITIPSISIFRSEHDLLVEDWTEMDILGVIKQISQTSIPDPLISAN